MPVSGKVSTLWMAASLGCALAGCLDAGAQIAVRNRIAATILVKDVSFNGCLWPDVIAYDDATKPTQCPAGEDRIRFKKLDLTTVQDLDDPTLAPVYVWYSYQTAVPRAVGDGDFRLFDLLPLDLEQDFSVPGPFGH